MPNQALDQDRATGLEPQSAPESASESFGAILSEYEQSHSHKPEAGAPGVEATVVAVSAEFVFLDVGRKTEGVLPLAALQNDKGEIEVQPGDQVQVSITGQNAEGYYELSRLRVQRPKDWSALEKAFADKTAIAGVVSGVIKGGLSVDVGVRAFMPASRSGARDAAEMEKLVGQEIRCRIIKLDVADEDVVVDRRAVLEEEEKQSREQRVAQLAEGSAVRGVVRTLTDYGAFVDVGGVDGLLHVADISWGRVNKPADVLSVGQEIDVKILKIDPKRKRISLGMKQLTQHPWDVAGEKYKIGERLRGIVTRTTDFGAFVELEPGIEGLVHVSDLSWAKKVRKPSDVVKAGDAVEVMVLAVSAADRRISLGLKQALGDPWQEVEKRFPPGGVVEAPIVSLTKFGAFVQLAEGVEGMIHVGDISAEKRINHPQDVLKEGQAVRAQILEVDRGRRRIRLGLKQLQPTTLDEYIAEHKEGDVVTGRLADVSGGRAKVELGEGIQAACRLPAEAVPEERAEGAADLSSLSSMLAAKWKHGSVGGAVPGRREAARAGQIRSFRIVRLDAGAKRIEVELAS